MSAPKVGGGGYSTIGKTAIGATRGTGFPAGAKRATFAASPDAGFAVALNLYCIKPLSSGVAALRCALYRDIGGGVATAALVACSAQMLLDAAKDPEGWYSFPLLTRPAILASTTYWLAVWTGGVTPGAWDYVSDVGAAGIRQSNANAYDPTANPSNPFGANTGGVTTEAFSMYLAYQARKGVAETIAPTLGGGR